MKKYFLLMLLIGQLAFETKIYAQNIAINATGGLPDASAMLDINSTSKGFLAPRMTTTQQNAIPVPANGLLIFNTTDNVFKVNTGTTISPVWTPLATGSGIAINSLNGLTGTTQTFATGTTGTDFGISSTGTAHTFNLPTASATNRGALSAADWTIFSGKQGAISLTTTGSNGAATLASNTLNVPTYTLAGLGGIALTALSATTPLNYNNTTGAFTINQASTSINGYLSSADWNTFNSKQGTLSGTANRITIASNVVDISSAYAGQTSLTTVGTVTTGTWNGSAIGATYGGTGQTTVTTGDLLYGSASNTWSKLPAATNGQILTLAGGVPTWATNPGTTAWSLTGNSVTAGSQFLGSTNNVSLRMRTNNVERMMIDSVGNVGIGMASQATSKLAVKDSMEVRRTGSSPAQFLFTNTAGSGDFRIGGDGGDIYWQGGGGRSLQMGSFWPTIIGGDRQTAAFPAFVNGSTGTSVIVAAMRDASVALGIQANSGTQTANLTEWRNAAGSVLSLVDKSGNMGIGVASPTAYLHLKAGTASANTAPLKFTSGTVLTTPESGAVEFDGTHFYGTAGVSRYQLDQQTPSSFSGNLAGEVTGPQSTTVVGNAAVIGKVLTGYTSAAGTVAATDNILQAIQKINGNDALKATIASPILTGIPAAPTATAGTNTTQIATTAFVASAVSSGTATSFSGNLAGEVTGTQSTTVVGNAAVIGKVLTGYTSGAGTVAATDNILQAIQKVNGNDALKAPLASPTLTGIPAAPTATAGTNTTQIATTAFVTNAVSSGTTTNFTGSLAGDVTGTQSVTVVGKINGTSLAGLGTGILKNTTGTGVPSIAVAVDFPILNQNTTGTAANVTGTVAVANGGTGQVSTLTAGGVVYGSTSTAMAVSGAGTSGQVLQSTGASTPVWVNGGTMMLSGNSNNNAETTVASSQNNYFPIVGTISTISNTDVVAATRTLMSRNGTIKNLYVKLSGAAGGNKNIIVTVYLNGTAQTLSVTITGGSGINSISGQDFLHPVTVVAGDEVGIVISSTSTPNHQKVSWSADFTY